MSSLLFIPPHCTVDNYDSNFPSYRLCSVGIKFGKPSWLWHRIQYQLYIDNHHHSIPHETCLLTLVMGILWNEWLLSAFPLIPTSCVLASSGFVSANVSYSYCILPCISSKSMSYFFSWCPTADASKIFSSVKRDQKEAIPGNPETESPWASVSDVHFSISGSCSLW